MSVAAVARLAVAVITSLGATNDTVATATLCDIDVEFQCGWPRPAVAGVDRGGSYGAYTSYRCQATGATAAFDATLETRPRISDAQAAGIGADAVAVGRACEVSLYVTESAERGRNYTALAILRRAALFRRDLATDQAEAAIGLCLAGTATCVCARADSARRALGIVVAGLAWICSGSFIAETTMAVDPAGDARVAIVIARAGNERIEAFCATSIGVDAVERVAARNYRIERERGSGKRSQRYAVRKEF
jgi:hypothetical protein